MRCLGRCGCVRAAWQVCSDSLTVPVHATSPTVGRSVRPLWRLRQEAAQGMENVTFELYRHLNHCFVLTEDATPKAYVTSCWTTAKKTRIF